MARNKFDGNDHTTRHSDEWNTFWGYDKSRGEKERVYSRLGLNTTERVNFPPPLLQLIYTLTLSASLVD
jgi:hypothetical protein